MRWSEVLLFKHVSHALPIKKKTTTKQQQQQSFKLEQTFCKHSVGYMHSEKLYEPFIDL